MFGFRVDANAQIATGHVMRCMTIAKEIERLGEPVIFITADQAIHDAIKQNGFTVISLNSQWNNMELELSRLIVLIEQLNITKVLVDSYYVTETYLLTLKRYTTVIYMDDLNTCIYPVDILINYNIYSNQFNYTPMQIKYQTTLLLGCEYAPLREEFREIERRTSRNVKKILITTGGADQYHVSLNLLEHIVSEGFLYQDEYKDIEYHFVVGKYNQDREKLQEKSKKYKNIIVHCDVIRMGILMKECDLAISAAGFTLYELCACGLPMVIFTSADNQISGAKEFARSGLAIYAGDVRTGVESLWYNIKDAIVTYVQKDALRERVSAKMQQMVDGNGSIRLAKELIQVQYVTIKKL